MSTIKVVNVQLGQSATASNNFTFAVPSTPNGTFKISRGNAGATTSDVISLDSGNIIHVYAGFAVDGNVSVFGDFNASGNIGTTSNVNAANVTATGNVNANNINASGNIYASGNVTAYSDIRIKTDVKPISDALTKVLNLEGVTYTRADTGNRETGLIAQNLIEVLPEAVFKDDRTGMLSIAYGNVVGLLVQAIKEQQRQIDELKSKS